MPRLVVCGRQCSVGSDDLVIPATLEALAYLAWLLWCANCVRYDADLFTMHGFQAVCFITLAATMFTSLILSVVILHFSLKGTIINTNPRRSISSLLLLKRLSWSTLAPCQHLRTIPRISRRISLRLFPFPPLMSLRYAEDGSSWFWSCLRHVTGREPLLLGLLSVCHHAELGKLSLGIMTSNIAFRYILLSPNNGNNGMLKWWMTLRFSSLGAWVGLDNHPALGTVSTLFVKLFKDEVDVVPTDILACFLLLKQDQGRRIPRALAPCQAVSDRPVWMRPDVAAHYMRFAGAAYGWPMYTLRGPLALFNLANVLLRSRYVPRKLPDNIIEDNPLLANTTVIKMLTGLSDTEIVYVTYHNKLFEVPFFVALDHIHHAVVVSVRGTLSLEDVLTDLLALECDQTLSLSAGIEGSAHEGMTNAARYLQQRLLGQHSDGSTGLLDEAWLRLYECVGHVKAKEYQLVITGHSLGAGVAAILAILMRQVSRYSDLRCFAFSPPGGLLSKNAAEYCDSFICSVVLGDDVVCRLGLYAMFDFKTRVLNILKNCDLPKHVIFGGWLRSYLSKFFGSSISFTPATSPAHVSSTAISVAVPGRSSSTSLQASAVLASWTGNEEAEEVANKYKAAIDESIKSTVAEQNGHCQMFLPGTILYINEIITSRSLCRTQSIYSQQFCCRDDSSLTELLISPDMIRHHVPWAVLDALDYLAANDVHRVH